MPFRICRSSAILSEWPVMMRDDRAANRPAEQIKIAENIENFMARKFVGEAQIGVDDFFVVDENEIAEPSAIGQSHSLQLRDIAQKAEGPRRRDFSS